jgi:uncharacterized delta-60 repeat protein
MEPASATSTEPFARLDDEFGVAQLLSDGYATNIEQDSEERIFIWFKPETNYGVARYTSNAQPDLSFGNQGYLLDSFTLEQGYESSLENCGLANNKILITGAVYRSSNRTFYPAAARYSLNGVLDKTLNNSGRLILDVLDPFDAPLSEGAQQSVNHSIDQIAFVPALQDRLGMIFHFYRYGSNGELGASYLIALNDDGSLYLNFNNCGYLKLLHNDTPMRVRAMLQQPNGKILIAAQLADVSSTTLIRRVNRDGTLDANFADNGTYCIADSDTIINCLTLTDNGGVLALGTRHVNETIDLVIFKLTNTGKPDEGFNGGSPVYHSPADTELIPLTVQLDSMKQIIVAGRCFQPRNSNIRHGVLMRFDESGGFDKTSDMVVDKEIGEWAALSLLPGDKLLVTGHHTQPAFDTPIVARYLTRQSCLALKQV